jgi:superfamily II DNA or RNA helicase
MPPKIKVGLKNKENDPVVELVKPKRGRPKAKNAVTSQQLSKQVLLAYLRESFQERFKVNVEPKSWVLPNRAKFPTWLDVTFKYAASIAQTQSKQLSESAIKAACSECSDESGSGKCSAQVESIRLFPHQQFIVDYMQFASPYRGVLLLHHLGSGKSCSSTAAAEVLANNMNVVVMTPASLRGNYIEEIKKCGRQFYAVKQNWTLVSVADADMAEICEITKLNADTLRKQGGIWVPVGGAKHLAKPFASLPEEAKSQIKNQIDTIIENRIQFINYNGLNKNKIKELTKEGSHNPFDNSCVVVDEIHNLIGRVVNKRQIGRAIYKLLMQAKNCKLILLSGTPIINQPHEIAYIINLLTGPRKLYELKINKGERFDASNIRAAFEASEYVDRYIIDPSTRKIAFELVPNGFKFDKRPNIVRVRSADAMRPDQEIVDAVVESLGLPKNRLSERSGNTLPEDADEFNRLFINVDSGIVTNQDVFARRVMGTVSYYKTFSEELYPSVKVEEVLCPLTDYQFSIYEKSRQEERRKESKAKRNGGDAGGLFGSNGQVYRFYSRANCNFVFPEAIKRPFPTSASVMKGEVDMAEEGRDEEDVEKDLEIEAAGSGEAGAVNKLKGKRDIVKEYHEKLNAALSQLGSRSGEFLTQEQLEKVYSPKMAAIVKRLMVSPGTSLVYSQFRTVEGLGVLGMALKHLGWAELKLKKTNKGEFVIDTNDIDALTSKPFYTMFTGNNDESKILLKIFNRDLETVPENLRNMADKLNLKVIMITQSGAEGISLKNVRQVHVMEPYWNQIRVDQVIGRAVRTCSHVGLPRDQRNVTVYLYRSVFTPEQLNGSFTIRTQDKSETSDQYIHSIAQRKASVINKLLATLQNSAIDCALNAKYHQHMNNLRCFSFPVNMKPEALTYEFDISKDKMSSMGMNIVQKEWEGQVLITKKGQFLIRPETSEVYDYDLYLESGRLVRLGRLVEDGKTRRIEFEL